MDFPHLEVDTRGNITITYENEIQLQQLWFSLEEKLEMQVDCWHGRKYKDLLITINGFNITVPYVDDEQSKKSRERAKSLIKTIGELKEMHYDWDIYQSKSRKLIDQYNSGN